VTGKTEFVCSGRECLGYTEPGSRILMLQGVDENDLSVLEEQIGLIRQNSLRPFTFVTFRIGDWNSELSPWPAPPVFGKTPFGSGAPGTLSFLENELIPEARLRFGLPENCPVIIGGYSLAAFFALWASYKSCAFSAVAAASPSVWFPRWIEEAEKGRCSASFVYLSLGDREEKTRNPVMAAVGNCIRRQKEILDRQGVPGILEWNEGNHFTDTGKRCAKAFVRCLENIT
jgi:predicted alpha/beta superfamily hydrolase